MGAPFGTLVGALPPVALLPERVLDWPVELAADEVALVRVVAEVAEDDEPELEAAELVAEPVAELVADPVAEELPLADDEEEPELPSSSLISIDLAEPERSP